MMVYSSMFWFLLLLMLARPRLNNAFDPAEITSVAQYGTPNCVDYDYNYDSPSSNSESIIASETGRNTVNKLSWYKPQHCGFSS